MSVMFWPQSDPMSKFTNRGRVSLAPLGTTPHLEFAVRNDPTLRKYALICEVHSDHLRGWLVRNTLGSYCLLASIGAAWTLRPLLPRKVTAAADAAGIALP